MLTALLLLAILGDDAQGAPKADRAHRVRVEVASEDVRKPFMPMSIEIDGAALLRTAGSQGRFSAASLQLWRVRKDGSKELIPLNASESFSHSDQAEVRWVVENPEDLVYELAFDELRRGPYTRAESIALVGCGDNLRYNRPQGRSPIHAHGMLPISADFDGDGKVDLVSRSIYSSTWGQPWFTIWFWKNVGTNDEPIYADFVRLYSAIGEAISNHYSGCDLYDWNGDSRLDLVTSRTVYQHTGKIAPSGAPVLERLEDLPSVAIKGEPYCWFFGLRDHDGDGVHDAFYQLQGVHYSYEGPPPRNYLKSAIYRKVNVAPGGQPPILKTELPILRGNQLWIENQMASGFWDVDNDGDQDLIGSVVPLDRIPPEPAFCYWPNIAGKNAEPVYADAQPIPGLRNMGEPGVWGVENAAYRGLLAAEGHRVRYYRRTANGPAGQLPTWEDAGLLEQLDGRCAVDGYSSVDVVDWEGDGDWDLVAGDETGSLWLIRNRATNKRPVFENPAPLMAAGVPIRIQRWHYIQDGNPEYFLGQAKPRYADWDGDGDLDLIVANNTDRLLLFDNIGTREAPKFAAASVISVGNEPTAFVDRCQPAVLDWNFDGLTDLVTTSKAKQLCLFLRYRDGDDLKLRGGVPLLATDGNPLDGWQWEACDWDGDGDWDLIGQVGEWGKAGPGLFVNVGTNDNPRFNAPQRLKCWGKEICLSAHEHSFSAVDWYGTGQLDLVCGGESGLFFFFRRPTLENASPPQATMAPAR